MTIYDFVRHSESKLAGIDTARLDIELLISDQLGRDRSWIIAHPEFNIDKATINKLSELIDRRATYEPLAYIRQKSEFYGREFKVTPDTLQPRPETETMVEMCLAYLRLRYRRSEIEEKEKKSRKIALVDVGTGSGCIAITLALELQDLRSIYATDISAEALNVARFNADKYQVSINFHQGNLLAPIITNLSSEVQDLIVLANLPYVPDTFTINQAARHEPDIAIFGGKDGLDLYRQLFAQLSVIQDPRSKILVLTESLPPQHEALRAIAEDQGYTHTSSEDFVQCFIRK